MLFEEGFAKPLTVSNNAGAIPAPTMQARHGAIPASEFSCQWTKFETESPGAELDAVLPLEFLT